MALQATAGLNTWAQSLAHYDNTLLSTDLPSYDGNFTISSKYISRLDPRTKESDQGEEPEPLVDSRPQVDVSLARWPLGITMGSPSLTSLTPQATHRRVGRKEVRLVATRDQHSMSDIITRSEARALGLTKYCTGKACKHGHTAERYVSNWECCVCKDANCRLWQKANPLKTAVSHRRATKNWRLANPDKHREHARVGAAKWRHEHPDECAAVFGMRGARLRGAVVPQSYTTASCAPIYAVARRLTRETGVLHEVDHIIPIARGGQHVVTNLQVLTKAQNLQKGAA